MLDKKSQKICILTSLLLILGAGLLCAVYLYSTKKKLSDTTLIEIDQILNLAALKVHQIYLKGDNHNLLKNNPKSCLNEIGDMTHTHPFYTKCNPGYLNCFFSGKLNKNDENNEIDFSVRFKNINYQFFVKKNQQNKYYNIHSKFLDADEYGPTSSIELVLYLKKWPEVSKTILLENACSNVYLPWGRYIYGPISVPGLDKNIRKKIRQKEIEWDNYGRNIYIDKYLVTNRDVVEWKEKIQKKLSESEKRKELLSSPSIDLSKSEREEYCFFRGGQVMQAEIFDAATFLPLDERKKVAGPWRYPYPWGNYRQDNLFNHVSDESTGPQINKDTCSIIYSHECLNKFPFTNFGNNSTSWVEINQIMGGPLESMRNPIDPYLNLKTSSFYFNQNSSRQQLGSRVHWEGDSTDASQFIWVDYLNEENGVFPSESDEDNKDYLSIEKFEVGFRCYYSS